MGLLSEIFDLACDYVIEPAGNKVFAAVEECARHVDAVVNNAIDGVGTIEAAIKKNPEAAVAVGGLLVGGVALIAAPAVATAIGSTGALGAASTGAPIVNLSGAAKASAALAKLGGGAKSIGGGGMVAGKAVISGAGGGLGAGASSAIAGSK